METVERTVAARTRRRDSGSAVLFALFACLTIAMIIQVVGAMVLCADRLMSDENEGRQRLYSLDSGLSCLLESAAENWVPSSCSVVTEEDGLVEGDLLAYEGGEDWLMIGQVRGSSEQNQGWASMLVERGRDGLDLPLAALVAKSVQFADSRSDPWLDAVEGGDESLETAVAWLRQRDGRELLYANGEIRDLRSEWNLGQGWVGSLGERGLSGERVIVMRGAAGETLRLPEGTGSSSADLPILAIALGGASLDLSGRGELWGVLIVDEGSIDLEGTVVHGALFAGGSVDFGLSGRLVFSSHILGWARDSSLERVRLAPGTRAEGNE